ncbi:hypothetical protein M6B38_120980 [Iris pallida]|uniref:Uncharacterized protein n=1 Tax=Iris pallida TaxID=29817 RepID=A0AAX6HA53_IRIPA|nr:hypothetical protein M6B38_120975 [Iris pallida]KAJ6837467.1 hypothetical protein M6B38_120980 [Iris pallida]
MTRRSFSTITLRHDSQSMMPKSTRTTPGGSPP